MITLTNEQCVALTNAQLEHARDYITLSLPPNRLSDDGADYLTAALNLASYLVEFNNDPDQFEAFLNNEFLLDYACDGICQAIYDLKPACLED